MAKLKEFNTKLKSLKNTQKITKTMKMVSVSKLRKAQMAQIQAKSYARKIAEMMTRISSAVEDNSHPLIQSRANLAKPERKAHIIVVTSDKGLAGAFNINANKKVLEWVREHEKTHTVEMSFAGKKGWQFFNKRHPVRMFYQNVTQNPTYAQAEVIGKDIIRDFLGGKDTEVYITYNQFFSPLSQKTVFEQVLPIRPEEITTQLVSNYKAEYEFEPDQAFLLNYLVEQFVFFKIYFALLENSAGEHGARMTAMDNATNNAKELISRYTLLRNRARQAAITTELTEIVAGAEALN